MPTPLSTSTRLPASREPSAGTDPASSRSTTARVAAASTRADADASAAPVSIGTTGSVVVLQRRRAVVGLEPDQQRARARRAGRLAIERAAEAGAAARTVSAGVARQRVEQPVEHRPGRRASRRLLLLARRQVGEVGERADAVERAATRLQHQLAAAHDGASTSTATPPTASTSRARLGWSSTQPASTVTPERVGQRRRATRRAARTRSARATVSAPRPGTVTSVCGGTQQHRAGAGGRVVGEQRAWPRPRRSAPAPAAAASAACAPAARRPARAARCSRASRTVSASDQRDEHARARARAGDGDGPAAARRSASGALPAPSAVGQRRVTRRSGRGRACRCTARRRRARGTRAAGPRRRASRQSLEEIASAGTSSSVTAPAGKRA